jgi:hypothetical protein
VPTVSSVKTALLIGTCMGWVMACGSASEQPSPSDPESTSASGGAVTGGGGNAGVTASVGGTAGTASSGGSGGLPPEHCYPQCLWDLVSICRPISRCISEKTTELSKQCDPDSEWTWSLPATSSIVAVTHRDGSACYTIDSSAVPFVYYDSDGQAIARVTPVAGQANANTVQCEGSSAQIAINPSDPECAPWAVPICTPGTCP